MEEDGEEETEDPNYHRAADEDEEEEEYDCECGPMAPGKNYMYGWSSMSMTAWRQDADDRKQQIQQPSTRRSSRTWVRASRRQSR